MSGRIHLAAPLLAALLLLLLPGCDKVKDLLGQAGSAKAKGKVPPGLVISFKGNQVIVDGESVGDIDAVKPGKLKKIDGLFDTLKEKREEWKSRHPGKMFPGMAVLRPEAETPANVVLSAFQSSVYAGYPRLAVETPSGFVPIQGIVPKPPSLGEEWKETAPLAKELVVVLTQKEMHIIALHGFVKLSELKVPPPGDLRKGLEETMVKELGQLGSDAPIEITLRFDPSLSLKELQDSLSALDAAGKGPLGDVIKQPVPLFFSAGPLLHAQRVPYPVLDREDNPLGRLEAPAEPTSIKTAREKSQLVHYRIHTIFPWLRDCYESGLAKDIKLDGTLLLRLKMGEKGVVKEVSSTGDLADKNVVQCIEKEIAATTFGELSNIEIYYPLMLLPLPEGPAKPPSAGPRLDGSDLEGASDGSGRLPPELIQRIVRQNFGRFRLCYENGLRNTPNLKGRVKVRFVIGLDGKVSNVSGGGDIPDAEVITCVTRAFYGLEFPKPEGGIVTVSYPIVFEPGG